MSMTNSRDSRDTEFTSTYQAEAAPQLYKHNQSPARQRNDN